MMPGVDGLELCRRIRAEEESGFAYIILITARAGKKFTFHLKRLFQLSSALFNPTLQVAIDEA